MISGISYQQSTDFPSQHHTLYSPALHPLLRMYMSACALGIIDEWPSPQGRTWGLRQWSTPTERWPSLSCLTSGTWCWTAGWGTGPLGCRVRVRPRVRSSTSSGAPEGSAPSTQCWKRWGGKVLHKNRIMQHSAFDASCIIVLTLDLSKTVSVSQIWAKFYFIPWECLDLL